jgi:type IV pilus assembly protein PilC
MYPAVIIFAMMGVGILMLVMVVPQLAQTFEELHIKLPLTTRITIFLGTFLIERWYLVIFIVIGLAILLQIFLKTKKGKQIIDSLVLEMPIISGIAKKTNAAYTIRTLSALIASGVPLVNSLEIVANALGNAQFKKVIKESIEKVRKGEKLSEVIKKHQDIYPPLVFQMMAVGEETGRTSEVLGKLADFYEEEVTNATKNLSAIVEPILMLFIGAVVGFFAVSMIQPMYSMLGAL